MWLMTITSWFILRLRKNAAIIDPVLNGKHSEGDFMSVRDVPTVVFFNRWTHKAGHALIKDNTGINIRQLNWDAPEQENWPELSMAHGYQISSARQELPLKYHVRTEFLLRCPKLLVVSADGAGYDTVDVDACTEAGVIVVNQSGANREAVAEHVLGMMLCLSKRMIEMDRVLRRKRGWHRNDFIGNDILEKTVGIIGLGNIGTRLTELCIGLFGAKVLAYDPYLTEEQIVARGAEPVTFTELLLSSDFVSVNCPLTAETRGMINSEALAQMKSSAYFVTTARGGIHDEAALVHALETGEIRGAGVDVWVDEPPSTDHALIGMDNVILTMHTAGITEEARRSAGIWAADQWAAIWRGEKPPRLINPEAWPLYKSRFRETFL